MAQKQSMGSTCRRDAGHALAPQCTGLGIRKSPCPGAIRTDDSCLLVIGLIGPNQKFAGGGLVYYISHCGLLNRKPSENKPSNYTEKSLGLLNATGSLLGHYNVLLTWKKLNFWKVKSSVSHQIHSHHVSAASLDGEIKKCFSWGIQLNFTLIFTTLKTFHSGQL